MTDDLKAAVLAYLDECAVEEVPPGPYDAPVFRTVHDLVADAYHWEWVRGRPDVTAVALDLLERSSGHLPGALGWDGECLTMPGGLRYRPVGLDDRGQVVVCRRVGP